MSGVVVGIDGSDNSQHALDWAVREAAAVHAPLTVLAVHQVAANHWTGKKARHLADEAVTKAVSQAGDARPASVTVRAVSGLAAKELIEASRDADLVVVGSRGGGGFVSLLMGSVSSQVVNHAHCPVVVVRN